MCSFCFERFFFLNFTIDYPYSKCVKWIFSYDPSLYETTK